jgi:hypothetical protein
VNEYFARLWRALRNKPEPCRISRRAVWLAMAQACLEAGAGTGAAVAAADDIVREYDTRLSHLLCGRHEPGGDAR